MAAPFGRRNPQPDYQARLAPSAKKSKPKPSFTSNSSLYACIAAAIAVLVLAALAFS